MTSDVTPSLSETSVDSTPQQARPKRKGMSLERLMIMFTLFFFTGVLLLVVLPEGSPVRMIAMTIYSLIAFLLTFFSRFWQRWSRMVFRQRLQVKNMRCSHCFKKTFHKFFVIHRTPLLTQVG